MSLEMLISSNYNSALDLLTLKWSKELLGTDDECL